MAIASLRCQLAVVDSRSTGKRDVGRKEGREGHVDVRRRRAEGPRACAEVIAGRGCPQGDPPRVFDVWQELLREGERSDDRAVGGGLVGPGALTDPMAAGTCGDPAFASAVVSSTSGFSPGCSCRNTLQITGMPPASDR